MEEQSKLSRMSIAAPCTSSWDKMTGDETVRFCHECKLNVYNISSMPERDAEELIRQKEGKLCVRFYRRKDGTVLTDNCPVGLRRIRNFGRNVAAVVAFITSWLIAPGAQVVSAEENKCPTTSSESAEPPTMGPMVRTDQTELPVTKEDLTTVMGRPAPYRSQVLRQIASVWTDKKGPIVNIQIKMDGTVEAVEVLQSCGTPDIDTKAVKTIKTLKFDPLPAWYKTETVTLQIDMLNEQRDK